MASLRHENAGSDSFSLIRIGPRSEVGNWNGEDGSVCLELRWAGHQLVIAGTHPETKGYSWLPLSSPAEIEMAPAPDWLLEPLVHQEQDLEPVEITAQDSERPSKCWATSIHCNEPATTIGWR